MKTMPVRLLMMLGPIFGLFSLAQCSGAKGGGSMSPPPAAGRGGAVGTRTGGVSGSGGATAVDGAAGSEGEDGGGADATTDGDAPVPPTSPTLPPLADVCDLPAAHTRAASALAAAITNFWVGANQYVRATSTASALTSYGSYAQAFDAVLDGVERTGGKHYGGLIRTYYEGGAARGWLTDHDDDQAWMTLALVRAFDFTSDQRYLDTAETIFDDIMTHWDTTCCGSHRGSGIWWDTAQTEKTTAANAASALAGVRLATRTGNAQYLDFAKRVYNFWLSDMVDPQTFAVYDHLTPDGQRTAGAFTYNYGAMIGAALELNSATGEAHYLDEAQGFGHDLRHDGHARDRAWAPSFSDGATCNGACATWKGIGYRYLAQLFRRDPTHQEYRDVLISGANALWALARNTTTTYFSSSWAGLRPRDGGRSRRRARRQSRSINTRCSAGRTCSPPPPGIYQAEESWLDHVDAEAGVGRGFIGFGYVSTFVKDKQGFAIDVTVAKAGMYSLDWLYTAGEGTCARSVLVNGQLIAKAQTVPATPSWTAWQTSRTTTALPAGKSTVELRFDAAQGSVTSLDVDQLTVAPM